jgi:predicted transcriptional regulator
MYADFEFIDASIFGSQLRILEMVNMQQRTIEEIRPFYDAAAAAERAIAGYAFDQYITFLIRYGLMLEAPDARGHYTITVKGRTFLMWRVERGKVPSAEKVG